MEPQKFTSNEEHGPGSCENGLSTSAGLSSNGGEVSSSSGLGLSHGRGYQKYLGFTFLQLRELEHQALIYKYMVAGHPVPSHLIIPIWKSVASNIKDGRVHQYYSTLLGSSALNCDSPINMDPEPGRCRRTDGKKWRCSKDVVQDQKYCEKHVHRGRQRSTKHVHRGRQDWAHPQKSVFSDGGAQNN
ncbi:hypothetical protein RJ639_010435 [Escallonia herrerae]|uniref:Growth-regulating factor n=1 Tax=Escallonia herrerae TaxID=1293975 RepID=A0AA88VX41_9ASTE|nr:hypothetical protein RJ639_010435 [Escallonia herrerae]